MSHHRYGLKKARLSQLNKRLRVAYLILEEDSPLRGGGIPVLSVSIGKSREAPRKKKKSSAELILSNRSIKLLLDYWPQSMELIIIERVATDSNTLNLHDSQVAQETQHPSAHASFLRRLRSIPRSCFSKIVASLLNGRHSGWRTCFLAHQWAFLEQ